MLRLQNNSVGFEPRMVKRSRNLSQDEIYARSILWLSHSLLLAVTQILELNFGLRQRLLQLGNTFLSHCCAGQFEIFQ